MGMSTATGAVKEETYTIISASNEPGGHACMDSWRMPRESNATEHLTFKDKHHKDFYMEYLSRCRCQDVYHKALVYCLGLSPDTRKFAGQIYDFRTGDVKPECLREGWQTSGSGRIIRMAFNLYCNGTPSVYDYGDGEEQLRECRCYTVEDLFCCEYAVYFWEAVKIRYPEFARRRI